jgi:hypothetical protein
MSMKNSNDTIGNWTRDLPACGAVPQPTAPPRAPKQKLQVTENPKIVHPENVSLRVLNLSLKKIEINMSGRWSITAIIRCQNSLYNRQLKMIINMLWVLWGTSSAAPSRSAKPQFGQIQFRRPILHRHRATRDYEQSVCRPIRNMNRKRGWNICVCMNDRRCLTTSTPMLVTKDSETTDLNLHTARLRAREDSGEFVQG